MVAQVIAKPLPQEIERDTDAVKCSCKGYAGRVDCTVEECRELGCGRDTPQYQCCARAFVCELCGQRYIGTAPAPEME